MKLMLLLLKIIEKWFKANHRVEQPRAKARISERLDVPLLSLDNDHHAPEPLTIHYAEVVEEPVVADPLASLFAELKGKGFDTVEMNSEYEWLGASRKDCNGKLTVREWLTSLTLSQLARVRDTLSRMIVSTWHK